ncbi:MAG: hypothetical protein ACOC8E_05435 [Planctomycetota bacterium]
MNAANPENASGFLREVKYIPDADIFLGGLGGYWDPQKNEWRRLDVDSKTINKITAQDGMSWDAKRKLLWLVKGKRRAVYVMKPDLTEVR